MLAPRELHLSDIDAIESIVGNTSVLSQILAVSELVSLGSFVSETSVECYIRMKDSTLTQIMIWIFLFYHYFFNVFFLGGV